MIAHGSLRLYARTALTACDGVGGCPFSGRRARFHSRTIVASRPDRYAICKNKSRRTRRAGDGATVFEVEAETKVVIERRNSRVV
jgi:hypothetical protein